MWIKSFRGDYYNMDLCREIYLDSEGYTHFRFDSVTIGVPGDIRAAVMRHILAGTKVLEVSENVD